MANMETGWVLFSLEKQQFGLPIKDLLQMVVLEKVTTQATAPADMRGLIQLRDRIIPVIDTRKSLGMETKTSQQMSLVELMMRRKEDHIHWIEELLLSVEEKRPFTLTRDPHNCAFGGWYDSYQTDNPVWSMHLDKFDKPHKRIHQLADQIEPFVQQGNFSAARKLIEHARGNELHTMIDLFDSVEKVIKETEKEIVLVMRLQERLIGFIVDEVYTVRDIPKEEVQLVDSVESIQFSGATRVAQVDGETSVLLYPKDIFAGVTT